MPKDPYRYSSAEAYLGKREVSSRSPVNAGPASPAESFPLGPKLPIESSDSSRARRPSLKSKTKASGPPSPTDSNSVADAPDGPLSARPISVEVAAANQAPRRSQLLVSDAISPKDSKRRIQNQSPELKIVQREEDATHGDKPISAGFLTGAPTPHPPLFGDDFTIVESSSTDLATGINSRQPGQILANDGEPYPRPQFLRPSSMGGARPTADTPSDIQNTSAEDQDLLIPPNGSQKIFYQMLSTRGRMQGSVFFRRPQESIWSASYCSIRIDSGSLKSEVEESKVLLETLIPDIRNCKTYCFHDKDSRAKAIQICSSTGKKEIQMRPQDRRELDAWFAAFLCWQPVRKGQRFQSIINQRIPKPFAIVTQYPRAEEAGRDGGIERPNTDEGDQIIEAGKATLIHRPGDVFDQQKPGSSRHSSSQGQSPFFLDQITTKVSCVLCNSCELSLQYSGSKGLSIIATVRLKELPRSAVQRVHRSVHGLDNVVALHPQYAPNVGASSCVRPIYLAFGSSTSFEVWFNLFRSCAVAEMYRAHLPSSDGVLANKQLDPAVEDPLSSFLFRIERSVMVRVMKASFNHTEITPGGTKSETELPDNKNSLARYFAEILLDGHVNAKSSITPNVNDPSWYESFGFGDLSSVLSTISVRIRRYGGPPGSDQATTSHHSVRPASSLSSLKGNSSVGEDMCGDICVDLSELDSVSDVERSWPMTDSKGGITGELLVKVAKSDEVVLVEDDYEEVLDVLHDLKNSLSLKICQRMPSNLMAFAGCFLNIFQASGIAVPWLMSLAEEEIQNVLRRSAHTLESSQQSSRSNQDREQDRPETSLIPQVSLLFRANTLFTKALDFFMKRIGQEYLEAAIGRKMRQIVSEDVDCEVDPNRLNAQTQEDLGAHWQHLIDYTKELWALIYGSASLCPEELRLIFQHIRSCAEARFGHIMPSVRYSSVSGFLFLRFFCPAIMNPQLFSLTDRVSSSHAPRTFVLIAKSLQGLANMTVFGNKEPWMSPMNSFCSSHRNQLKKMLDSICSSTEPSKEAKSSTALYSIPRSVIKQLPHPAREGCLSLPYLIDRPRSIATLIALWLDSADAAISRRSSKIAIHGDEASQKRSFDKVASEVFEDLLGKDADLEKFHTTCKVLRDRSRSYLQYAETANERRGGALEQQWVALAEAMEAAPGQFWVREVPRSPASSADGISPTARGRKGDGDKAGPDERSKDSSSTGSGGKEKKGHRKKSSPPRNAEANAMRKLGWM